MVFSSIVFIFYFLPLLLLGYYIVPKTWAKNILLFIASLLFYAWGGGHLLIVLLAVGLTAWTVSYLIAKTSFKKGFLVIGIIIYLGILLYYKYSGFIISNLTFAGITGLPTIKILTSIGVSFYIFQAISYNMDVYRKNEQFEKNPVYTMLYLTMLPQLISGPLVRYHQLAPALKHRRFDFERFAQGIRRFILGLAKKVLIANQLSLLVTHIMHTDMALISPSVAWLGIVAFTLQLFFDFSGYTDMAIGVGKMLGFDLPENFNYPYISRSITEFWRRWHMTLSAWLRDYLFMPLSLSFRRWGKAGVVTATMITFVVCGIWHGPTWNFVIWGSLQGLFLVLEQLFLGKWLARLRWFSLLYTLLVILTGFVFIMTPDLKGATQYLTAMFAPGNITPLGISAFLTNDLKVVLPLGILFSLPLSLPKRWQTERNAWLWSSLSHLLLLALLLLSVMTVATEAFNPFIYFRF